MQIQKTPKANNGVGQGDMPPAATKPLSDPVN
jgi:hypothetical protein